MQEAGLGFTGGLDHALALVTLGVLGYRLGRPSTERLPAVWIMGLGTGILLAAAGVQLPFRESGLIESTILLAAVVLVCSPAERITACGFAAAVSLHHGLALRVEEVAATDWRYVAGLLTATLLLYVAGLGFGRLDARHVRVLHPRRTFMAIRSMPTRRHSPRGAWVDDPTH
jgi:urease accessory protein